MNRQLTMYLLLFSVCLAPGVVSAMEIAGNEAPPPLSAQEQTRSVRADFISLGFDRKLESSDGSVQLPSSARVIDHRKHPDAPAKVDILYRGDAVTQITIYQ